VTDNRAHAVPVPAEPLINPLSKDFVNSDHVSASANPVLWIDRYEFRDGLSVEHARLACDGAGPSMGYS